MYSQLVPLILFCCAAAFTPGPNNILGSYSGFNFGIRKSLPLILGVTFGYTSLLITLSAGLIIVFKNYPFLQVILKISGSLFLIYLAYKISFKNKLETKEIKNPVKFLNTFFFQYINPKGVIIAIICISTFVESGSNYLFHTMVVVIVSFIVSAASISSWCLLGKFLKRFATNKKFIQIFNYIMSFFLIVCVIIIYL